MVKKIVFKQSLDSDIMAGIKIYSLDDEEHLHLYFSIDIYAYVLYM